jgi:phytoene dehydrogenase-like protein
MDAVFKHQSLPEHPNFYIHAPSRTDSSAAPAGGDTMMVLVPVGHETNQAQNWSGIVKKAREDVLSRLGQAGVGSCRPRVP